MNLILSDVEETIMIVEMAEDAPDAQGTVNVRDYLNTSTHQAVSCPDEIHAIS